MPDFPLLRYGELKNLSDAIMEKKGKRSINNTL